MGNNGDQLEADDDEWNYNVFGSSSKGDSKDEWIQYHFLYNQILILNDSSY